MGILGKCLQGFLAFVGISILLSAKVYAGNEVLANSYDEISKGQRIELKEGDISIIPPMGWEVFTKHPSLTLLMQVPHDSSLKYQRTIQVASFSGKKFIDEVTAKEFEEIIVNKFSQLTNSIEEYKVREHRVVDMADGRDGILIYTEFQLEEVNMMQAHILVSSEKRHYLMTFTDLADHFEKEEYSQYLNEAWSSMVSVELAGGTSATLLKKIGLGKYKRFQALIYIGFGLIGLIILFQLFKFVSKKSSRASFEDYGSDDDSTGHAPISQMKSSQQSKLTSSSPASTMGHSGQKVSMTSHSINSTAHTGPAQTGTTKHESRLGTAHAAEEEAEMDEFFADDDEEDDKAI